MIRRIAAAIAFAAMAASPASAAAPDLKLWRLDCGEIRMNDMGFLSDSGHYDGKSTTLTDSCYLIKHGADFLLWDAGLPAQLHGAAIDTKVPLNPRLPQTLAPQLARIGVRPDQIKRLGVSHYHADHVGQAALFPHATLIIGAADWRALQGDATPDGAEKSLLEPWLSGHGRVEQVEGDRDLFGDGSVVLLAMPGHTPGSMALLLRLQHSGAVLLSGDVLHLEQQWRLRAVPVWNRDRAESLASMERLEQLAKNLHARLIVQHDPGDIAKLPLFPASLD